MSKKNLLPVINNALASPQAVNLNAFLYIKTSKTNDLLQIYYIYYRVIIAQLIYHVNLKFPLFFTSFFPFFYEIAPSLSIEAMALAPSATAVTT